MRKSEVNTSSRMEKGQPACLTFTPSSALSASETGDVRMQDSAEILLITGPAGIGKSTLCWEIGAVLSEAHEAHAIIETDELDRVYPKPSLEDLERLRPGTRDVSS